ncbi:membrane protein [[Pantoea] beijingensis]|uniref:Membrane protein n=1 Tax=[Pantoea] beijingensis TaxID=1324864 RepID=A0A443IDN8_9GAMM|nr:lysylphosphatidylglycerol synthase domain-containing protein [[Pantoea] beijingensis]RWR02153.1 membrane protein [[Pantoea] beijingensis]
MSKTHPQWKTAKRVLTWLFFIAVIVLLVVYAKKVDWSDVYSVIIHYNRTAILSAVALVVVSYMTYGVYDLIGRAYCGHKLAKRQVMMVSFICYAFNLTLSTWVGGVAMRYRLYSRLGLSGSTITRIFSLSIATNWLGYILLAGVVFSAGMVPIPRGWFIGEGTLKIIGSVLLASVVAYLALCAFSKRRRWTIKGQKLALPSLGMALFQFAVSCANWMVMGTIIWLLLAQQVDYPIVLGVLLISSIAGVIIHIPAGIGVLEAVFLALLSGQHASHGTIIAALLAYRVLYFIAPLLLALVLYLWLEGRASALREKNALQQRNSD